MSEVVLTHGFLLDEDPVEQEVMRLYPPLGILYLAAYLKANGVDARVLDPTFMTWPETLEELTAGPPAVVGVSTTHVTRPAVVRMVAAAKESGHFVVVGGPDSGSYPDHYLEAGCDVVVLGEGEETLLEVVRVLQREGRTDLARIPGLCLRTGDGRLVTTEARPRLDVDTLPWPDRDAVELQRYLESWRAAHGTTSLNVLTSRGCPYSCRFCSRSVFGSEHRRRSPVFCADEIEHVQARCAPDQLWLTDDVFTMDPRWLRGLADELRRRRLDIRFETVTRADRLQRPEVARTLAEMGCSRLWIGSESGSPRLLQAMGRGVSPEQIRRATALARSEGIEVGWFLMWGWPGEQLEDIRQTVEHVSEGLPDLFFTTLVHPIGGTPLYEQVEDRLLRPGPWRDISDRQLGIRGRPDRPVYRHADRWLRAAVEARRLAASDPVAAAAARRESECARVAFEEVYGDAGAAR